MWSVLITMLLAASAGILKDAAVATAMKDARMSFFISTSMGLNVDQLP
jgi:hypothetical protein